MKPSDTGQYLMKNNAVIEVYDLTGETEPINRSHLFALIDSDVIRQLYADFALDRVTMPPPPPPAGQKLQYDAFEAQIFSKRKRIKKETRCNGGSDFQKVFQMFQNPSLVQGDSDVSTPLPLTTNTNPLVTQVTFEDERRRMTAPMEIDDTFDDSVADNGNSNRVMAASVGTTHMKL